MWLPKNTPSSQTQALKTRPLKTRPLKTLPRQTNLLYTSSHLLLR
jgi:hypothetical protein